MSIQVLSSEIVNQIAAGEVVERPSHLVKELMENSLDAQSDQITVEVSEGGRFVRVQDNGSGIFSSDLEKALQRHATSKITQTDDLWNLHTFGFRGEALASAAAVSQLTLKSIHKTEKKPSQIESVFGKVAGVKPSSQSAGTEIQIENLFENVPARLKFLKSESSEISQIKSVFKALALAHHGVEFKLIANGQLQLFYPKRATRLERAADVLEKKVLFEAQSQNSSFNCHVVFSSPHDVARTSKQIWVFAQNRWVQDRAIITAVMDAYRSLLMHGEYPYAVVWLECKPDEIDVNIHPTKSQIKFQDPSGAFRAVHHCLRQALEKAPWIPQNLKVDMQADIARANAGDGSPFFAESQTLKFTDHTLEQTHFKSKSFASTAEEANNSSSAFSVTSFSVPYQERAEIGVESRVMDSVSTEGRQTNEVRGYWSSLQVLGQANLTYIICQKEDRLVFVDQHAAHERVVYESLMRSWKNNNFQVQSYLFPLAIDLSEEKLEVLLKNSEEIQKMGFEIEQLGPESLGIKSAPHLIKDSSLPVVFERMAQDLLNSGGSFAIEKKISDLFATMACHSVIRAGQSLSIAEIQQLLQSMDEFALSSFCPHGRPVSVEKTFTELEKLFGRIN
ncbi:DNA mismatch repair endonuclease MutL [Pseudobdellovibrio exovorus]|uniref:DNA mismatch repair protein MutL n=1 Tax=Pseudobdellovibrio exovorus JSS TaxID=1184267 RepID=M4V8M9_9BACT|nr:DNA mismatch repair endonuclease MutL [Pseudobdellovibrio exovorus]AGH95757.1 DNA mismatch repair protein MutL [Pseudobdellovibrio exovorus JSS]